MKKVLVPAFLSLGVLLLGIVYLSTPEIEEVNFNSPELWEELFVEFPADESAVDESTVDESTEVGVPTEVGGLITIGDPTEEETPTEVETPAEPETPAKPEVPAKVETPVTVEEPLPTEASSVPESVPELVEPIELGDAVSTFSFGTNMSRNWTTSASNKQKCIVIGRTERNGSASVRDIIIDWGEGAAQSLSGIGVYTSAGAQTYNKVCHTYASAKEYGVHITTPDRVAYLDLSSQNVNAFEAGTWGTNLIYLSLDDNDLYSLAGGAFRGLTKLEKLYLSNNAFSALPPDLFQGLTMLKVIELSRNNLTALPDTIFNGLTALVDLDLSYNALGANSISAALLTNLNNLEIVALAGNGLSVLPSAFVSGRTKLTDLYFYENNLLELPSLAGLTKLRVVSAFDTALDTSGYNAFLNTFKTIPTATGALYASPASYGGCVANASLGIAGHTTLTTVPNIWVVNDAGLESCVISGSLAYSPDTTVWTNSGVVATLTLDTTGTVSSAGWTPSGAGTIFTKTYISNTGETVNFVSPSGATGSASVVISSIINSGSLGAIVSYTPAQNASGDITVTVTLNTTGGVAPIHWSATGAYAYTRIYTTTTLQSEETFSDVAGNTIETQINLTIDRDAPVATNVSYSPHTVTNSGVTVTLTTNEVVVKPSTRSWPSTGTVFTKVYNTNTTGIVSFFDLVGNSGSTGINITRIDTNVVTGSVSYSVPTPTNGDVLATVSFVKTGVVVTSTGGTSHLFTGDGTWTFTFQDPAGNTGSAIATVSGIDKIAPTATVINYSTTNPTNGSVTVTLTTSENVSPIAGWTGNTGTSFTKVYDTNAVETIFFYDLVGNQGYTGISIQNITNDKPIGLVSYSPNSATSGNVTAIIQVNKALASTPTGRNATGTNAYYKTYASNTGETLLLTDTAGNTGNVDVTIARIDTTNPTAITVSYDPNSATNGNVTATLTISEPIDTPIGWAKTDATTYTKIFFENTGYTQTFYDLVGNEGSTGIVIDRISTSAITGEISYSTTGATSGNVIATLTTSETVNPIVGWDGTTGTTFTKTFISNANGHVVFQNALGTQGSATYDIDWIDTTAPSASVFYTPSANPQWPVLVTITLSETGNIPWWTDTGDQKTFTKSYASNTTETITFYDSLGNAGSIQVQVSGITQPSSGGGGGGSSASRDVCPKGDYTASYYDGECGISPDQKEEIKNEILWELGLTDSDQSGSTTGESEHNESDLTSDKEMLLSYERAKEYGITTAPTYESARLSDTIIRGEMAKMISTYAIKLLNKTPDKEKRECIQFQDLAQAGGDLQPYVIQSCQLGLMGMNGDGIGVQENFFPTRTITRAEVGTLLSRLLRGTKYATQQGDETYYGRHLQALKKAGIMNFISDPDMLELRGNVFLMLWRMIVD